MDARRGLVYLISLRETDQKMGMMGTVKYVVRVRNAERKSFMPNALLGISTNNGKVILDITTTSSTRSAVRCVV